MRLQTNNTNTTTTTATGTGNLNHGNGNVIDPSGMKSTTTTMTTTKMTDTVVIGLTEAQVVTETMSGGGMTESVRDVSSGNNDGYSSSSSSHSQVLGHTETSSHDPEPEVDDLIDDQDDDAMREQDQATTRQSYDDDVMAVARLGEWLREQQTMEDALVLLQQEGWMF